MPDFIGSARRRITYPFRNAPLVPKVDGHTDFSRPKKAIPRQAHKMEYSDARTGQFEEVRTNRRARLGQDGHHSSARSRWFRCGRRGSNCPHRSEAGPRVLMSLGPGTPSLMRLPICNEYGCCRVHTRRVKFSFMIDPFSARRRCPTISAVQDPSSSHGNWSVL